MRELLRTLFVLGALTMIGCSGGEQERSQQPTISLHLVHGPEVRPFMSSMREKFHASVPRIADGSKIQLELVNELGAIAADRIASGELKPELWLAPSSSLVSYANSRVRNLGSHLTDCTRLFDTPMVFAAQRSHLPQLVRQGTRFSWNEVIEGQVAPSGAQGVDESRFSFGHTTPRLSTTGLAALTQLAYLAAKVGATTLSREALAQPTTHQRLQRYQSFVSNYGLSESYLLHRSATPEARRMRLTLTTEQQLALFNSTQLPQDSGSAQSALVALYPIEGSVWEDYQLCVADADWVTPPHRAAAKVLAEFLLQLEPQTEVKRLGFRPVRLDVPEVAPLTPRFGVDLSLPERSFLPLAGPVVHSLIEGWRENARPSALVLVLDSSGSMEGDAHRVAKEQFRNLLAHSTARDLKALVSFSTRPELHADLTERTADVITKLDGIQALGGSAIYDSLKMAVELLTTKDLRSYRKVVLLLTDGEDKTSELSLQRLLDLLRDKFSRHDINLVILAINREGSRFADLQQIAQITNGFYRETSVQGLVGVFQDIFRNIQSSGEVTIN